MRYWPPRSTSTSKGSDASGPSGTMTRSRSPTFAATGWSSSRYSCAPTGGVSRGRLPLESLMHLRYIGLEEPLLTRQLRFHLAQFVRSGEVVGVQEGPVLGLFDQLDRFLKGSEVLAPLDSVKPFVQADHAG